MDSIIETQNRLSKILNSNSVDWVKKRGMLRIGFSMVEIELMLHNVKLLSNE